LHNNVDFDFFILDWFAEVFPIRRGFAWLNQSNEIQPFKHDLIEMVMIHAS